MIGIQKGTIILTTTHFLVRYFFAMQEFVWGCAEVSPTMNAACFQSCDVQPTIHCPFLNCLILMTDDKTMSTISSPQQATLNPMHPIKSHNPDKPEKSPHKPCKAYKPYIHPLNPANPVSPLNLEMPCK